MIQLTPRKILHGGKLYVTSSKSKPYCFKETSTALLDEIRDKKLGELFEVKGFIFDIFPDNIVGLLNNNNIYLTSFLLDLTVRELLGMKGVGLNTALKILAYLDKARFTG